MFCAWVAKAQMQNTKVKTQKTIFFINSEYIKMKFEEVLKYAASGIGMLAGGGMFMGEVIDFGHDFEFAMLVVSSLGAGVGYGGLRLMQYTRKGQQRRVASKQERRIMQLAAITNGCVTLPEVTLKLDMDVEEAKKHLENLQTQGIFDYEVTASGTLLYSLSNYNQVLGHTNSSHILTSLQ